MRVPPCTSMPSLALPGARLGDHTSKGVREGISTLLDLLPDRRQVIRATQGQLVAVDLRSQLAGIPFASINPNPSYSGVRLRVSDSHDFISVEIRLFLARGRVSRSYVSRNYLRATSRTPGDGLVKATMPNYYCRGYRRIADVRPECRFIAAFQT